MNKALLFVLTLLLAAASLCALDFGLVINQKLEAEEEQFLYTPEAGAGFSGRLGERFRFYLSGKAGFEYVNYFDHDKLSGWRDEPVALFELGRSELSWLISPSLYIRVGRQAYRDLSGFAANGLFDGAVAGFSALGSRFSLGAYYTGLLYRDAADILMTQRDRTEYGRPLSESGAYFASRRVIGRIEWENPSAGNRSSFGLGLLGQFDLNGEDEYHSQYLTGRWTYRFFRGVLEGRAAVGAGEDSEDTGIFFAGSLGVERSFSILKETRLGIWGTYSSPSVDDTDGRLTAFVPITSVSQGQVFSPALGGLSVIRGFCTIRPVQTLSLKAECSWFIRTDMVTLDAAQLKDEGYMLGGEIYGTVQWTPVPDMTVHAGGGAFFPSLGNAFEDSAEVQWKAVAGITLSL